MPKLDIDTIEVVCSSIDNKRDLLSVSLTSSVLQDIAIRQLLRSHTIYLGSRKTIRVFYAFIFSHKSNLASHIRSLVIPANAWFRVAPPWETDLPEDVEHVMDILDCAENLDTLDLSLPPSYEFSPRLSSTLAAVNTIRHLSLSKGSRPWDTCWVHHALQAIRSPLVTLRVRSRPERYIDFSPSAAASHFGQSFSHFSTSSTLTTLYLDHIPMYDDSFLQLPRFLSVRSLILTRPLTREPNLAALLHLFPSLDRTLSLRMAWGEGYDRINNPETLAEIQENNKRAQVVSRWTKLDTLECDYTAVQLLALQCPVRRLTTDTFDFPYLGCVRPQRLVIDSIRLPSYDHISTFHKDEDAVADSSSITHAVLIVTCNTKEYEDANRFIPSDEDMHWRAILKHTVWALAVFKNLTHARLIFHCARDPSIDVEDEAVHLDYRDLDRLVRKMRAASVSTSGSPPRRVLAACPALRCFVMTIAGRDETEDDVAARGWIRTRAWRVVDTPERQGQARGSAEGKGSRKRAARTLEQLSDYDTRRVIEDEDLGLPEAWEARLTVDVCAKTEAEPVRDLQETLEACRT